MLSNINSKRLVVLVAFLSFSYFGFSQHVPDQELKKNVEPVQNALAYVQQLEPKKYEYNKDRFTQLRLPNGQQYGFMAEDMQRILPELVTSETQSYMVGKNKYRTANLKNTDLESLIPILVGAIQEKKKQIELI